MVTASRTRCFLCLRTCAYIQYEISPIAPFSRALWTEELELHVCWTNEKRKAWVWICKKRNKLSWLQMSPFVQVCNSADWGIRIFEHKMDLRPVYLIKGKCGPTLITRGRSSWLIAVARRLHRTVSGLYKHPMQIQQRLKGKCGTGALIQDTEVWHISILRAGKI